MGHLKKRSLKDLSGGREFCVKLVKKTSALYGQGINLNKHVNHEALELFEKINAFELINTRPFRGDVAIAWRVIKARAYEALKVAKFGDENTLGMGKEWRIVNLGSNKVVVNLNESVLGGGVLSGVLTRANYETGSSLLALYLASYRADAGVGGSRDSTDTSPRGGGFLTSAEHLASQAKYITRAKERYDDAQKSIVDAVRSRVMKAEKSLDKDRREVVAHKATFEAHATLKAVTDVAVENVSVGDWRLSYKNVQRVKTGLDILGEFWNG